MPLECVGDDIVHLGGSTYRWVQLTRFTIDAAEDDRAVLRALIESDGFAHDYATPFPAGGSGSSNPCVHGRWNLDAVTAERFHRSAPEHAVQVIRTWANGQEWTEGRAPQPEEMRDRLEPVEELLRSGSVFELDNPDSIDEHDYGFVVGVGGFHEFVVIDRASAILHLIVAADD